MSFIRDLLFLQGFPTEPLFGPPRSARPAADATPLTHPVPNAGPAPAKAQAEPAPGGGAARAA